MTQSARPSLPPGPWAALAPLLRTEAHRLLCSLVRHAAQRANLTTKVAELLISQAGLS